MTTILAWHWSDGMKCRYDDRPIVVGETLRFEGELRLCARGLHASTRILDALAYAPGTTISRVRLSGRIIRGEDKLVATERTCLWAVDARMALVWWAADCATRALEREAGRETDPRSWAAVDAARAWVREPTAEHAAAASYAAKSAAYASAAAASYAAAHAADAAAHAADAAAHAADAAAYATDAAYHAAYHAAYNAADHADERAWQSRRLRALIGQARRGEVMR